MTTNSKRILVGSLIILFGIGVRLVFSYSVYHYFIDDAYISMRYAENFAHGNGLVYNQGERVIGFTSPLFQVLLALAKYVFRGAPTALLLNLINYSFFVVAVWLSLRLFSRMQLLCSIPILLLLYFPYIDASLSGMETMLLLTVILSAFTLLADGKLGPAIVVATISILVRPEGVFLLATVGLYTLLIGRRLYWKHILLSLCILGAWIASAYTYYGSVLPQSMLAKSAHITKASWGGIPTGILDKNVLLAFGFSDLSYTGWPASIRLTLSAVALVGVALLCFSLLRNYRQPSFLLIPAALYFCIWAFYVAGRPIRIFSWYSIPTSLCFFIGVLDGCRHLAETFKWHVSRTLTFGLCVVGCAAAAVIALPSRILYMRDNLPGMERFAAHVAAIPGVNSIMLGDIGLVGYTSGLRIVDSVGLVSPVVMSLAPAGQIAYLSDLVERERPSVLCLESNPLESEFMKQSERLYRTFRDRTEADSFNAHYARLDYPAGRYHFVFVERALVDERRPAP